MRVRGFEVLPEYKGEGINLPQRKTAKSAAYDIEAAEGGTIYPGTKVAIKTGLRAYMLDDERLELHVRSGHAFSLDLTLQNGEGVIDADFYGNPKNGGHIVVLLRNEGESPFSFLKGDRIAQGIFSRYLLADHDDASGAREGGFGSTGVAKAPPSKKDGG